MMHQKFISSRSVGLLTSRSLTTCGHITDVDVACDMMFFTAAMHPQVLAYSQGLLFCYG